MAAFCEVALPVPLDHTFTYGVRLGQRPQRGARAWLKGSIAARSASDGESGGCCA